MKKTNITILCIGLIILLSLLSNNLINESEARGDWDWDKRLYSIEDYQYKLNSDGTKVYIFKYTCQSPS